MTHYAKKGHVENFSVNLGAKGRIVLPARLRKRLNLRPGERMIITVGPDGGVRLRTIAQVVDSCLGMYKHLGPPGVSQADELIKERRQEVRREETRWKNGN